jgi:hypothetical protein
VSRKPRADRQPSDSMPAANSFEIDDCRLPIGGRGGAVSQVGQA